jgi:hypothetical protein
MVPQGLKKWGIRVHIHMMCRAVYLQESGHGVLKWEAIDYYLQLAFSTACYGAIFNRDLVFSRPEAPKASLLR